MARLKAGAGFTFVELLIVTAIVGMVMAAVVGIYQVTQRSTLFATAGEDAQLTARAVLGGLATDLRLINTIPFVIPAPPAPLPAITVATATSITFLGDVDNTVDATGQPITLNAYTAAGATALTVNPPAAGTDLSTLFPCGAYVTIADGGVMESHLLAANNCVTGNTLTSATALQTYYPGSTGASATPLGSIIRSWEQVTYAWDPGSQSLCRAVNTTCVAPYADQTIAPGVARQVIATGVTNFQLTYLDAAGNTLGNPPPLGSIRAVRVVISVFTQSGDQSVTRSMEVTVRPRNL